MKDFVEDMVGCIMIGKEDYLVEQKQHLQKQDISIMFWTADGSEILDYYQPCHQGGIALGHASLPKCLLQRALDGARAGHYHQP